MYTQCPECKSIFEVTATDLAVAGGFVRCGQCTVSFDALSSLSDSTESLQAPVNTPAKAALKNVRLKSHAATPKKVGEPAKPATGTDTEAGASPDQTEFNELADDIGRDSAATQTSGVIEKDADDIVKRQSDEGPTEKAAMSAKVDDDEILLDDAYEPPFAEEDEDFYDDDELIAPDQYGEEVGNSLDDRQPDDSSADSTVDEADSTDEKEADESALFALPLPELIALEHPEHGILPEKLEGGAAARDPLAQARTQPDDRPKTRIAGDTQTVPAPIGTRANDAFDAEDARDLRNYLSAPKNRVASAAWIGGSVLMVLLLLGQVVHHYRGQLVIHPRLGPLVGSAYKAIGADLLPNWRIDDYKVVGQARLFLMPLDNVEDEDATAIRFVTIISNGSTLPQPAPMVRLTLRDRWGDPTGMRDFTPAEYAAERSITDRLLEPGERLRVVLNLHDLGAEAVGFDFDMCLPDEAGTLRCASENTG